MNTKVLNYRVIIEPENYPDGSPGYNALCPTLDIADYGDSIEAVLASIKDGIELAIESLAKEGKNIPVDHVEDQIITTAKVSIPSNIRLAY
jgi:predicted RNase H-like HicB family nuclease